MIAFIVIWLVIFEFTYWTKAKTVYSAKQYDARPTNS